MSDAHHSPTSASAGRGWIVGLLALVAAGGLSVSYFTHGTSYSDIRNRLTEFYPRARPGWLQLTPEEIDYAFNANPDLWTTLAVRSAYGRWRLREAAAEPFNSIMAEYERAWWIAPGREIWAAKFKGYDDAWLQKRAATMKTCDDPAGKEILDKTLGIAYERPNDSTLLARFPGRPFTWQTGSRIRLLVDVLPEDFPSQPVKVYWETERAPGMSAHRRRLATWERIDGAMEGWQRLAIDVDFSWEPVWIFTGSIARGLRYRVPGTNVGRWKPAGIEFGDSEWLTIRGALAPGDSK